MAKKKCSQSNEQDQLKLEYVALSSIRQWGRNPKLHNIPSIKKSIVTYGFKDPLKFETKLNNGKGGIIEGNGRDQALLELHDEWILHPDTSPPRGILVSGDDWLIPVLFGVDAPSQAAAEAYGIDHNNLVLPGVEIDDLLALWNDSFNELARKVKPISVDLEELENTLERISKSTLPPDDFKEYGENISTDYQCPKCGYRWSGKQNLDAN